jgi:hypothetical protein
MTVEQAMLRLGAHGAGTDDVSDDTFADAVWRWRHGGELPAFEDLAWAIVDLLQVLLDEGGLGDSPVIPRSVAYAIAEVLTSSTEIAVTSDDPRVVEDVNRSSWIVACAWEAACAGDVTSLRDHVRAEQHARGVV